MNLPNKLTVVRMILVPVIIALYLLPIDGSVTILKTSIPLYQLVVCLLFIVASVTDFLDGMIARKYNLVTTFGKFMDPIADKVLVNSLIILLAWNEEIPVLVAIIMICRDIVVDAVRMLAVQKNVVIPASFLGKAKTFTQMFAIIFVLLNNFPFAVIGVPIDMILVYAATAISAISGYDYVSKNSKFIMESI